MKSPRFDIGTPANDDTPTTATLLKGMKGPLIAVVSTGILAVITETQFGISKYLPF